MERLWQPGRGSESRPGLRRIPDRFAPLKQPFAIPSPSTLVVDAAGRVTRHQIRKTSVCPTEMKRMRAKRVSPPLEEQQSPPAQLGDDDEHSPAAVPFSPDFITYLTSLHIDPTLLALSARHLPRYIRLNPRIAPAPTVDSLAASLAAELQSTAVPNVYRVGSSAQVALAASASYKQGAVYGIDLASVLAVRALSLATSPPAAPPSTKCVHVLDLCCAPGAKLAYIHDLLATEWLGPYTITGVDVSLPRLSSCRNLLHKYQCRNITLCLTDGRTFQQPPPPFSTHSPVSPRPLLSPYVIHDLTRSADGVGKLHLTKRQKKALRRKQTNSSLPPPCIAPQPAAAPFSFASDGYHHILVDAQCSHDGSIRHLVKQASHSAPHLSHTRSESCSAASSLPELQRALLSQAWSLLRVGGVLVYSTCSTQREQNEDVVEWLIEQQGGADGTAQLCPVFCSAEADEMSDAEEQRLLDELRSRAKADSGSLVVSDLSPASTGLRWKRGLHWARLSIPQECVRLSPLISGTSGLFIAKLRKLR